jgi:hypothetical protein
VNIINGFFRVLLIELPPALAGGNKLLIPFIGFSQMNLLYLAKANILDFLLNRMA